MLCMPVPTLIPVCSHICWPASSVAAQLLFRQTLLFQARPSLSALGWFPLPPMQPVARKCWLAWPLVSCASEMSTHAPLACFPTSRFPLPATNNSLVCLFKVPSPVLARLYSFLLEPAIPTLPYSSTSPAKLFQSSHLSLRSTFDTLMS